MRNVIAQEKGDFAHNSKIMANMFHGRKKIAGGNQIPFITKDLSKGMIKGSKLRNRHWKNRGREKRIRCAQQRNSCLSFLRKTKIR